MYKYIINRDKCINCGICADVCKTAKVYKNVQGEIQPILKDKCWECGQCIAACPKSAIEYSIVVNSKDIKKDGSLMDYFKMRRSVRLFNSKVVSRQTVEELLNCTRWIPSAQNQCDVEWVCIDNREKIKYLSGETVKTFKKTADLLRNPALNPILKVTLGSSKYKKAIESIDGFENLVKRYNIGEDPIFHNAPVVLFTTTPAGSYFGKENSIYAGYNLMINALDKGLSTCRIGYFDVAIERNKTLQHIILGKNSDRKIQTTIILGYSKYKFYNLVQRNPIKINWK